MVGRMLFLLAIARERQAMRHLIAVRACSVKEAEQKVLYLISAAIAFNRPLSSGQVTALAASIEPFRVEVRSLLQHDHRSSENGRRTNSAFPMPGGVPAEGRPQEPAPAPSV